MIAWFKSHLAPIITLGFSLAALLSLGSCTRDVDRSSVLRLSMPSTVVSGQNVMTLEFVIFNLRTDLNGGLPIVKEFEEKHLEHMAATAGTTGGVMEFVLDQNNMGQPVPKSGGLLVQYLGIFFDENDIMRFSYGDAVVDTSGGGDVPVDIQANFIGSSSREGAAGGRYFTSPTGGPSGVMVGYFQPPNRPRMAVTKSEMYNGWFNIFLLDSVDFTYEMLDGTPVFQNVNLDNFASVGNHVLKVTKPATYHPGWEDSSGGAGTPESDGERDMILGFFSNGNGPGFGSAEVCYPDVAEALPYMFTDVALSQNVQFRGPSHSPSAANARIVGGGVARSYDDIHAQGACNMAAGDRIRFYPQHLRDWEEGAFGMEGPFQMIKPFEQWGGFVHSSFDGANTITLNWKFLPGVAGNAVKGVTIFATDQNMDGDDGHHGGEDPPCFEELQNRGMKVVADLPAVESYSFTGGINGLAPVNNSNSYNFRIAVCPFAHKADGSRHYVSTYVEPVCSGGCGKVTSFGVGVEDQTYGGGTASAVMGASFAQVVSTTVSPGEKTTVTLSSVLGSFAVGDEVLIHVSGSRNNGDCGTWQGQQIHVGMQEFARVITGGGGTINIEKGTFLDSVLNTHLTAAASAANMCRVQVVKVLQYRNLTLNGAIAVDAFSAYTRGGILPIRVSDTMTLNASISALNGGYSGNIAQGSGISGETSATSTGGESGTDGAGGGGYGTGGDSADSALGGFGYGNTGSVEYGLLMGSGGGGGAGQAGSAGGGALLIAARNLKIGATGGWLKVSGEDGVVSSNNGGAGGAGSILVFSKKIERLGGGLFDIYAYGGDGSGNAGGGGGGLVKVMACEGATEVTVDNSGGAGFGTSQGGNMSGGDQNPIFEDPTDRHDFCRQ